ncbi:MAG: glycosyltransferase family 2 protein [Bacteroidia bacterium]|nr:glycosyltransferase family 2 protein [Bacteroidia bacterium]
MTDLSIIIVSYKGYERLRQCGYANGCNLGVSFATGSYILILNPDTVVTESSLSDLLTVVRSNSSFIITSCRQVTEKGRQSIAWGPFPEIKSLTGFMRAISGTGYKNQIRLKEGFPNDIFFPDWISGSVVMISAENYKRFGGFDEDFWMYFEDVDLCRRVRNTGGEIAFCNNISIEHNHGGSSRINKKTASVTKAEVVISRHIYINKHKKGIERFIIQCFLITNTLISSGITALAGIIFFFIPKLFLRTFVYGRILEYYLSAFVRGTWLSPRSVNYPKSSTL